MTPLQELEAFEMVGVWTRLPTLLLGMIREEPHNAWYFQLLNGATRGGGS